MVFFGIGIENFYLRMSTDVRQSDEAGNRRRGGPLGPGNRGVWSIRVVAEGHFAEYESALIAQRKPVRPQARVTQFQGIFFRQQDSVRLKDGGVLWDVDEGNNGPALGLHLLHGNDLRLKSFSRLSFIGHEYFPRSTRNELNELRALDFDFSQRIWVIPQ
jgi:hypothetical protein